MACRKERITRPASLREVNNLHKEKYFLRLGISNYMSWEVAKIMEICERNSWVKPSVYQGIYNALHPAIEPELLLCLRHYGIALYTFQPLAGGFLPLDIAGTCGRMSTRLDRDSIRAGAWESFLEGDTGMNYILMLWISSDPLSKSIVSSKLSVPLDGSHTTVK
ncbi:hypothetical protein GGI43DRAFT_399528 [Trichoderma evansii]